MVGGLGNEDFENMCKIWSNLTKNIKNLAGQFVYIVHFVCQPADTLHVAGSYLIEILWHAEN